MKNPYSLVFGMEPPEYISRLVQTEEVVESLSDMSQRVYMITGVRGSGKTVFMTEIKNIFAQKNDWVVIELSSERDMLQSLAAKLSAREKISDIFKRAKINLSMFGVDIELGGQKPVTDIEVMLQKMLEALKNHGKNVLVLVDEAIDNKPVREFASVFQILIRDGLPISMMMTGLYENIDDLQNEKNLTFLHRAPKIRLSPLSIGTMAASYRKNLKVDEDQSIQLAQMTRGYSYAFQALGSAMWEENCDLERALVKTRQHLDEYVYDKIWSELSEKDKQIVAAVQKSEDGKIKGIRESLGLESNQFAPYKKRLIRKGVIDDVSGYAKFSLPFFDKFVRENYWEE